jgi:DHA1 family inner membrane transport protein
MLITAYAVGVMLGAPVMTLLMGRFGKRTALMLLMSIFVVGNLLSALAPNYGLLLLSRLVTSLNHGAFFGIGAVVAASLVPKDKQAAAVATMFMGLTIANIGGVPLATWVASSWAGACPSPVLRCWAWSRSPRWASRCRHLHRARARTCAAN